MHQSTAYFIHLVEIIKFGINTSHNLIQLVRLFALNPRHERNFLRALHDIRTVLFPNQFAVLEEAFIAWKAVGEVVECHKPEAPDPTASEFTLELHAVGSEENSAAVKPALHKFPFVSAIKGGDK